MSGGTVRGATLAKGGMGRLRPLPAPNREALRGEHPRLSFERAASPRAPHHYFEHLSGLPAILWNAVPVNPPRIPHRVFPRHVRRPASNVAIEVGAT